MKKTLSLLLCSLLLAAALALPAFAETPVAEKNQLPAAGKCVHLLRRGPHPPFDHFHPVEAMQYASL